MTEKKVYTPSRIASLTMGGVSNTAAVLVGLCHGGIGLVDSTVQTVAAGAGQIARDTKEAARTGYESAKVRFAAKRSNPVPAPEVVQGDDDISDIPPPDDGFGQQPTSTPPPAPPVMPGMVAATA